MKNNRRKFIKNSLGLLSTAAISQNIFASELLKNNLEIEDCKYLDKTRAKKILHNV